MKFFVDEIGTVGLYHYSTLASINAILYSKKLRATVFYENNTLNDPQEHLCPGQDAVICFCATSSGAKLPLWYLYSGITGRGAALKFRPSQIRTVIEKMINYGIEGEIENSNRVWLKYQADFTINYKRILYCSRKNKNGLVYKWKGQIYSDAKDKKEKKLWERFAQVNNLQVENKKEYRCFRDELDEMVNGPFCKDYPWEYENEYRILIRLKEHNKNRFSKIWIDISDVIDDIGIYSGPNLSKEELRSITASNFKTLNTIILNSPNRVSLSSIKADMNIMENHKESVFEYFKKHPSVFEELKKSIQE